MSGGVEEAVLSYNSLLSTRPMVAEKAGTKEPIWAMTLKAITVSSSKAIEAERLTL